MVELKIIVIGAGPGGYVAAIRAAQLGAEVILIEKDRVGGTCLNLGCIPTKTLLESANHFDKMAKMKDFGIRCKDYSIDWAAVQVRKDKIVDQTVKGIEKVLNSYGIRIIVGTARFLNRRIVEVRTNDKVEEVSFDTAIIATGSSVASLPIKGIELDGVINSDQALSLKTIPKKICILGGGVIGTEFASLYSNLGSDVTMVELLPRLLCNFDNDVAQVIHDSLTEKGVNIKLNTTIKQICQSNNGVEIIINSDDFEENIVADYLLVAVGRKPNISHIGLENIGYSHHVSHIEVDENCETPQKGIYAIGDCTGEMMLAHYASAQAIIAVDSIFGIRKTINAKTVPACLYSEPEAACVGLTEEDAKSKGYDIVKGIYSFIGNGKANVIGQTEGFIKWIADKQTGELLGLHIVGPKATELIAEGTLAINLEATADEVISSIHPHPTLNEALYEAARDIQSSSIHSIYK